MMTKKQLDEMLRGMCAKKACKTIHSNGNVFVYVTYQQKQPVLVTTVSEEE